VFRHTRALKHSISNFPFVPEPDLASELVTIPQSWVWAKKINWKWVVKWARSCLCKTSLCGHFVRETNIVILFGKWRNPLVNKSSPPIKPPLTTNKTNTHHHNLHHIVCWTTIVKMPKKNKNKTKDLCMKLRWKKWGDKFSNYKRLLIPNKPYWKHNKEEFMMITSVVTLHLLETVAHTDVKLR